MREREGRGIFIAESGEDARIMREMLHLLTIIRLIIISNLFIFQFYFNNQTLAQFDTRIILDR